MHMLHGPADGARCAVTTVFLQQAQPLWVCEFSCSMLCYVDPYSSSVLDDHSGLQQVQGYACCC
jgi:hypothetical protein